ncbi:MAG: LytTR family transcriptional regulator [Chitinophagaceae bacterium]|nr:LytTR family transcriptional regulator [Chitinophagaceae bacterium]MCW5929776.1 LytTR family transcriptional regulator [Chitinophagaceae bacterium]
MREELLVSWPPAGFAKHDFVFVKSEYKIIKIKLDDILFCEGLKDYTQIYTAGRSQPVLTLQNLKNFSVRLPEDRFLRVHRSYIVSLYHLDSISRNEITIGKKTVPIGNSYRGDFFRVIEKYS